MLDDRIRLQILCQDHFSLDSVIIDTHLTEAPLNTYWVPLRKSDVKRILMSNAVMHYEF
jgi:hypothetical protein